MSIDKLSGFDLLWRITSCPKVPNSLSFCNLFGIGLPFGVTAVGKIG